MEGYGGASVEREKRDSTMKRQCIDAARRVWGGAMVLMMFVCSSAWGGEAITIAVRDKFSLSPVYIEILTEAYRRIGQPVTFTSLPGGSSLKYSDSGELEIDGEAGRLGSVLERYPNLRKVDVPIFYSELTAFVVRKDLVIAKWDDMAGLEITTRLGYKFVLDKLKSENSNVRTVESSDAAIKLVSQNRADVAILTKEDGIASINKLGVSDVRLLRPPVEVLPVYHMLNKKHQPLIDRLYQALRGMESDGYMDRVWSRQLQSLMSGDSSAVGE